MCKDWKKELTREEVKIVEIAMKKLKGLIDQFESSGTPFEKIFNNDVIKYKVMGNNFYVFKFQGASRTQARILYEFIRKPDGYDLKVHSVYIKRSYRFENEYFEQFRKYMESINK